jgi:hypothetical protein
MVYAKIKITNIFIIIDVKNKLLRGLIINKIISTIDKKEQIQIFLVLSVNKLLYMYFIYLI